MFKRIKMIWQAIQMKRQVGKLKNENDRLKKISEYERFLDEQLRENALQLAAIQRETEKMVKLTEAQRRTRALIDVQKKITEEVLEGDEEEEDFDDEEEEDMDNPLDRAGNAIADKILNNVLGGVMPAKSQGSSLTPVKENIKSAVDNLPDSQAETLFDFAKKYGYVK